VSGRQTRHLSLSEVIGLHELVMTRIGYRPAPFRAGGEGLLESAVMRPQMAEHYEGADVVRQAALLAVGLSQAQAFLDGNKRTAFIAADTFLRVNGHTSPPDSLEYARQLEAVAARADSLEAATDRFEAWLRANVRPTG
jgi:death-on-curing protein